MSRMIILKEFSKYTIAEFLVNEGFTACHPMKHADRKQNQIVQQSFSVFLVKIEEQ